MIKPLTNLMYKSSLDLSIKYFLQLNTFDSLSVLFFHRQKWLNTRNKRSHHQSNFQAQLYTISLK